MAQSSPDADLLSTNVPGMEAPPASEQDGAPGESTIKSRFKQKKLLVVLSAAALGGMLFGVSGMVLISYLQPAAKEPPAAPPVIIAPAPVPDPKQEAMAEELKELKAKNDKLEEQLRQAPPAPMPETVSLPAPAPVPAPVVTRRRPANDKEKVTADCTVPDKDVNLGEKLKSCIEGFNASTN